MDDCSECKLDKCKAAFVVLSEDERKHFIELAAPMAGIKVNSEALTEHLRLKEEENKQLQQDKTELVEALKSVAIQFDFDTNNEYEYLIIKEAKALLEKHK